MGTFQSSELHTGKDLIHAIRSNDINAAKAALELAKKQEIRAHVLEK